MQRELPDMVIANSTFQFLSKFELEFDPLLDFVEFFPSKFIEFDQFDELETLIFPYYSAICLG